MEDRYQLLEKIGQGGMGSVYRAHDSRMNREVAIKRIRSEGGDATHSESAEQIVKEAGTLASLQHPNIVTVYDVGADEDGPYVVMEFINGKTLDELIERAPLTAADFRELAVQTQEALIAAQDRRLIHRDLKPGNLMLTWLPSGKFQVKIVDFGLAMLTERAALDTLERPDEVFGSIFFMCPEQFERAELDARADLYSMGCVYYTALTQNYPFNGNTGMEVMTAHLHHQVTHLRTMRPDLPSWLCDWVMWHINRQPGDRPASARDALKIFLQNETQSKSATVAAPAAAARPPRPAAPVARTPHQASARPAPHPPAQDPPKTQAAPQPLLPPEGSLPSVHSSPDPQPTAVLTRQSSGPAATQAPTSRLSIGGKGTVTAQAQPGPTRAAGRSGTPAPVPTAPGRRKPAKPSAAKIALVTSGIILAIVAAAWLLVKKPWSRKPAQTLGAMITLVEKGDLRELPVSKADFGVLLDAAANPRRNVSSGAVNKAIHLARPNDGSDLDTVMVDFLTTKPMAADLRRNLIAYGLRERGNPAVAPTLMEFARSTDDVASAVAAMETSRLLAGEEQFPKFLAVIEHSQIPGIRQSAEINAAEILRKSPNREAHADKIAAAHTAASNPELKFALLRLLGPAGGPTATGIVTKALASQDATERLEAANAAALWADDTMFDPLLKHLATLTGEPLRARTFDAACRFLTKIERQRAPAASAGFWQQLARSAGSREEKRKVINAISAKESADWAIAIVESFIDQGKDDEIVNLAEQALVKMRSRPVGTKNK